MTDREKKLRDALESMVRQFAYWTTKPGGYCTSGLSALEEAFDALGWANCHAAPESCCDEPGCTRQICCGTPMPDGYRSTCSKHVPREKKGGGGGE